MGELSMIIGVVGPFGSGCTYVANVLQDKHSFKYISLSEILRKEALNDDPNMDVNKRENLQNYGNSLREKNGSDYLAQKASEIIMQNREVDYVVDSIRNPAEVDYFRQKFADFYLLGIFAEQDIR